MKKIITKICTAHACLRYCVFAIREYSELVPYSCVCGKNSLAQPHRHTWAN